MTVGRDQPDLTVVAMQEHTVELRAGLLGRSRVSAAGDQAGEHVTREADGGLGLELGNARKVRRVLVGNLDQPLPSP